MTTTVEKICVGGGESYFPDELLLDMEILDCSKSAEDDIPKPLTVDIIKEILDRIKKYVKENVNGADEDINEYMFQTYFYRFDVKFNYDYAQKLRIDEKCHVLFDMVMQAYVDMIYAE